MRYNVARLMSELSKHRIMHDRCVPTTGDVDERKKMAYVDKRIPELHVVPICLHEIAEREALHRGHSYAWAHAKSNVLEYKLYARMFGTGTAKNLMVGEERDAIKIFLNRYTAKAEVFDKLKPEPTTRFLMIDGKKYEVNATNDIPSASDVQIKGREKVFINSLLPRETDYVFAVYALAERRDVERGLRYSDSIDNARAKVKKKLGSKALTEMDEAERAFYMQKYIRHYNFSDDKLFKDVMTSVLDF